MTQPVGKAVTHQEVKHNGHGQKPVIDQFNGDISLWRITFWSQFEMAVHNNQS